MSIEKKFTMEEVETLLLVKALNDFEMPDCPEYTLNDKIENFEESLFVEEHDVFENGLDKLEEMGILVWDRGNDAYELTETGETLFQRLSMLKGFNDNAIKNILNISVSTKEFLHEHGSEIIAEIIKVGINVIR